MPTARRFRYLAFLAIVLAAAPSAQESGDTVIKRGTVREDLYLAGGTVDVTATVEGDVVAVGGQVTIDQEVKGDVLAAGGGVTVRAKVSDDVRLAGGSVTINGSVGDDAIAAGGHVLISPGATVGGRAFLAGGTVEIAGKVAKQLRAAGSHVIISGEIAGDVELAGATIEVRSGAVIGGNLRYASPEEAQIASDAKIAGQVTRDPVPPDDGAAHVFAGLARAGFYLSLLLTAIVFYLLFPASSIGAARIIEGAPWRSVGLGFAILAATPLAILILLVTVLGLWLGLVAAALYFVLLLVGVLTGLLYIGDVGLRLIGKRAEAPKMWRVLSLVAALVALWLVRYIPLVGGLAMFALLVFGTGALTLYLWRRYAMTLAPLPVARPRKDRH